MRRIAIYSVLIFVILSVVSCKEKKVEGPLAQYSKEQQNIIKLRLEYEIALENWILKTETNEIIMNLRIKNNAEKANLNSLTLKLVQYYKEGEPLTEELYSVDVSTIGNRESKTLLLTHPDAVEGIEGLSVELETYPPKERLNEYKEFP